MNSLRHFTEQTYEYVIEHLADVSFASWNWYSLRKPVTCR